MSINTAGPDTYQVLGLTSGPPTFGDHAAGDVLVDPGNVCFWLCDTAGNPGHWQAIGLTSSLGFTLVGSLLYGNGPGQTLELGIGSAGTVLTSDGTFPTWAAVVAAAHAASHAAAGSDPVTISQSQVGNLTSDLGAKAADSAVVHNTGNETVAGIKTFSSSPIAPTPTTASQVAIKSYVDGAVQGLSIKAAVRLATAAALPANTYAALALTASGNGALSVDGVAVAANDRILVKNEATASRNGIYTVTQTGDAGTPYILTRAADMDVSGEVSGAFTFVTAGSTLSSTSWTVPAGSYTLDTTAISWAQFAAAGSYTATAPITLIGSAFGADVGTGASQVAAGDHTHATVGSLAGLSDVTISSPANGDSIFYDTGTSKFVNAAPTHGQAIATVAASNSPAALAANATFTCTGTNDERIINKALSLYAHVKLLEGTFKIKKPIIMWYRRRLEGSGRETIIQIQSGWAASNTGETGAISAHDSVTASTSARTYATGAMTNGSTTLTASGAVFIAADVGTDIMVVGAGLGGGPLHTTVAARTSNTQITLATAASTTVSGATVKIGFPVEMTIIEKLGIEGQSITNTQGIHFNLPSQSNATDVDLCNHIDTIWIKNMDGHGIEYEGTNAQAAMVTNVRVGNCGAAGIVVDTAGDNMIQLCDVHGCTTAGFQLGGGNPQIYNCKSWFNNYTTSSADASPSGAGFIVTSPRVTMVGCSAQDNQGCGFSFSGSTDSTVTGCTADSNNRGGSTAALNQCGFYLNSQHMAIVGNVSYDRGANTNKQAIGFTIGSGFQHSIGSGNMVHVNADLVTAISGAVNANNCFSLRSTSPASATDPPPSVYAG